MTVWYRPRRCDTSTCPELAVNGDRVLLRNSEQPDVVVEFSHAEMRMLAGAVVDGEFPISERVVAETQRP